MPSDRKRAGELWTPEEVSELKTMLAIGKSVAEAAKRLGRTEEGTRTYARAHGLLKKKRRR